jgi:predicted nucleic acid-binding protein
MRIDCVVVNASPLICLTKSELSDLLPSLFTEIVVPEKVCQEITAKAGIDLSLLKNLRRVGDTAVPPAVAAWDLGEGENSVLAFSLMNPDYWAVFDDREARRCAASLGCRHTGTVGIIVLARKRGIIKSVRESLIKLQNAGLWLSESFIKEVCRTVGEE